MQRELLATPAHALAEALTEMLGDVGLLAPSAEIVVALDGDGAFTIIVPGCAGTLHAATTQAGATTFFYAVPALDAEQEGAGTVPLPNGVEIGLPVIRLATTDPVVAAHEAVALIAYFATVELPTR